MKMDYKEETIEFLKNISTTYGEEIAKKFKCVVDSSCSPVELENGQSAIYIEFIITEPQE